MSDQGMLIDDEDEWVVVILDSDWEDWSPWNVTAPDLDSAIAKAKRHWRRFAAGEDDWDQEDDDVVATEDEALEDPEIIKVYRASWIGERVL